MKIIRMSVEHEEGDLWVLVPDEGEGSFSVPKNRFNLSHNDIVDAEVDNGEILSVTLCPQEKERRLSRNSSKLASLFAKSKNKQ